MQGIEDWDVREGAVEGSIAGERVLNEVLVGEARKRTKTGIKPTTCWGKPRKVLLSFHCHVKSTGRYLK